MKKRKLRSVLQIKRTASDKISESLYYDIFNSSQDFLIICNSQGIIIEANQSLLNFLQYHSDELTGKHIQHVMSYKKAIEDIDLGVKDSAFLIRQDKQKMAVRISTRNIFSGQQRYLYVRASPKRAYEHQNEMINHLATILDNSHDHATIKDLDLKIIAANRQMIKDSGIKDAVEIIGKTDLEVFGDHPHVRKYMEDDRLAQKLRPGEYIEKEELFIYPDGRKARHLVRKFPIYNEQDEIIATANISHDITYLKRIQDELAASEEKYRQLIQNQGEGVVIINDENVFAFTNPAAEQIFGVKPGQLIGTSVKDYYYKGNCESPQLDIHYLRSAGQSNSVEICIERHDGSIRYLLFTYSQYQEQNINAGIFGIFRDITQRRKAEEALRQLNATKDKFFSIIAHDLKNPFGSISGFSEMILRKLATNDMEKIESYTSHILKASKQGFNLLENLLEWSRSQSGHIKYEPVKVSLFELVEHNVSILFEAAEKKGIVIKNKMLGDYTVFVDEDMLNTVLRNLISNAVKYTNRKGEIQVFVTPHDQDDMLQVHIKDNGIGIEPEDMGKLFKIDQNFSTRGTDKEEGTGLGLILVKEFVQKNKGNIWVESHLDMGSEFIFTVPKALQS